MNAKRRGQFALILISDSVGWRQAVRCVMPRSVSVNSPDHWHKRAAEMRALSKTMDDVEIRAMVLRLTDEYDELADRAEARAKAVPQ
jgi:hypothetical protein